MKNHTMEILAPAGDWDMLRAAVFSGADCVYVGVSGFNARRTAANFHGEELERAVHFCHARNCEVYAAVNTVVLPGQEKALEEAVRAAAGAGCDALIVQDPAVAVTATKVAPGLPLHASTQMSVHSLAGVRQLAEMGFSRVILARELAEEEIAAIAAQSPIELEVFVHGALCVCLSGQCYMSAFLGGRSANRGACAGPCRLPFEAQADISGSPALPGGGKALPAARHHLSLKDLSVLEALPRLEKMGIKAVKIEGRLRGPEYCAVAVDSARKALAGQPYDAKLLRDIFSRNGFTDGWFGGKTGGEMFGMRTEADTAASKAAAGKARELYRREAPRVPVRMALVLSKNGGILTVEDGTHTVRQPIEGPLPPAEKDAAPPLEAALRKTGGTPFYLREGLQSVAINTGGVFLPAVLAAAARREALEKLLELRGASPPKRELPPVVQTGGNGAASETAGAASPLLLRWKHRRQQAGQPLLRARFEHVAQLPREAAEQCDELIFPLSEAEQVPQQLRSISRLWLPRALFGRQEEQAARQIEQTRPMGFAGYEVQNISHLHLCKGLPMAGGFGLNVTNSQAALFWHGWGCESITLSPELSAAQLKAVAGAPQVQQNIALDMLCYGHLPLMLTRACPLKNAPGGLDCGSCPAAGTLTDRKGVSFQLRCRDGARSIYNPVPLWLGDKLEELPTLAATLYFTTETRQQAGEVLAAFAVGKPAPGPFTRGLYNQGTSRQAN